MSFTEPGRTHQMRAGTDSVGDHFDRLGQKFQPLVDGRKAATLLRFGPSGTCGCTGRSPASDMRPSYGKRIILGPCTTLINGRGSRSRSPEQNFVAGLGKMGEGIKLSVGEDRCLGA